MNAKLFYAASLVAAACTQPADAGNTQNLDARASQKLVASAPSAAANKASLDIEGLEAGERFYGIYMKSEGKHFKVGWMRQAVEVSSEIRFETEMYAEIVGMGSKQTVELNEKRIYDPSGALRRLSFEQKATTGSTRIVGTVEGEKLDITISAGGASVKQQVRVQETLDDFLAPVRLALRAKRGAKAKSSRFDASIQKQIETEYEVLGLEERTFAGVETTTIKIESTTPALGVKEVSWYDENGTVLESRIGGFFKASLESPEVAKKIDTNEDFIKGGVVVPPSKLRNPTGVERLKLELTGVDQELPQTSRQQVKRVGAKTIVTLSRDAAPQQPWAFSERRSTGEYLDATPFIQSDDAEIISLAKKVVGDASDVFTATSRLATYVYAAIRDEYVPAYSNAKEALASGRGDCTEHSVLFVAMARALGIPARVAVGVAYWPPGNGFGWHAWAEIKSGDDWYAVDPTWNQPIADATHLKLAGGGPAEQSRVVMLMGEVRIVGMSASGG